MLTGGYDYLYRPARTNLKTLLTTDTLAVIESEISSEFVRSFYICQILCDGFAEAAFYPYE
jgi:hypothetical protein